MSDLAANTAYETQARAGRNSYPIANGVTLYAGCLVSLQGGYLNHWADGANDVFLGLCIGGDLTLSSAVWAILGNTALTPVPEGRVNNEGVTLMHLDSVAGDDAAALIQDMVGDLVYCSTSNTDDMTLEPSTAVSPIGYMSRWRSATDVDVTLFTPTEFLAQATV